MSAVNFDATYSAANFSEADTLSQAQNKAEKRLRANQARLRRTYENKMKLADDAEASLNVVDCWAPEHPEYKAAMEFKNNLVFIKVVEELERLVVQRIFELSKSHLSSTGA